jgi:GxxExxY protein
MGERHNPNLKHREITDLVLKTFYEVYNELGHGFLESIYENALSIALQTNGLRVETQSRIDVWFRGQKLGDFFADIVVEDLVVLELKAVRSIDKSHEAQLLHYLRATPIEVGLLLNFGEKPEFKRMAFDNERKKKVGDGKLSLDILFENN